METLTVAQLVSLGLESRQIVITIDDEIYMQGIINHVDTNGKLPWLVTRDERGFPGVVFSLSEESTITLLSGGEIHIQEGVYQVTVYPQ